MKRWVAIVSVLIFCCVMTAGLIWGSPKSAVGERNIIAIPIEYGEPPPIVLSP